MKQQQNKLIGLLCCLILLGCGGQEQQAPPTESPEPAYDSIPGVDMSRPLVTPEEKTQMAGMILVPYVDGNRWGFADTSGKVVIAPKYWSVKPFGKHDLALVKGDLGHGLINKLGREVVAPVHHDPIVAVGCGIWAFVEEERYAILNNEPKRIDGKQVINVGPDACGDGLFMVELAEGKVGYMDAEGVLIPIPPAVNGFPFRHGVAPIMLAEAGKWIIVDRRGNPVGKAAQALGLDGIYPFTDGLGVAYIGENSFSGRKWGVLDTLGQVVLPIEYGNIAGEFRNGYVAAAVYDPFAYPEEPPAKRITHIYNRHGKKVGQTKEETWDGFSEGLIVFERNNKYGFMDTTGKVVIPPRYDWACEFGMGIAWVKRGERYGFIDHGGKEVIPLRYESLFDYYEMDEDGVLVADPETGEKFYIDMHGREYRSKP